MKFTIKIGVILINTNNEVLLIKEKYHEEAGYKWNLVKGTHDVDTENLLECAQREIKEEVGMDVSIDKLQLKDIFQYGDTANQRLLFVFHAANVDANAILASQKEQSMRGESINDVKWFNEKELTLITENDCIAPYVYLALNALRQGKVSSLNIIKI